MASVFGQVKEVLLGLVSSVLPFVQAIAPSVVLEFNGAMKDLQATIGSAFIGIVQVAASVARELGGVLLPIAQQLAPVFTTLANMVANIVVPIVRLLAVAFELYIPVLKLVAELFEVVSRNIDDVIAIFTAVQRVFNGFIQSIFGTETTGLKDIFKGLLDIVRQVMKAFLTLVATIAVALGAVKLVTGFADALGAEAKGREDRPGGLKAAGTNPAIEDVGAILKNAQLAAFTAQGGGPGREKTDSAWLAELSGDLKKIAGDGRSLEAKLTEWWNKQVMDGLLGKVCRLFESGWALITEAFEKIKRNL